MPGEGLSDREYANFILLYGFTHQMKIADNQSATSVCMYGLYFLAAK